MPTESAVSCGARSVCPPEGCARKSSSFDTEEVPGDPARNLLHFDAADHRLAGYAWDFPTIVDGQNLVCRGIYHVRMGGSSSDPDLDIRAMLASRLAERGLDINATG